MRSVIRGTGMVVPPHVVDNHRFARAMDTSDAWIRQRTGIVERRFAPLGSGTSDLGAEAARRALEDARLPPEAVDYLIVATMTPDHYFPGAAPLVQRKAGLGKIPSLDIRQQCTGFLHALQLADSLLRAGTCRSALVVGAEVHGGFMPWTCWDVMLEGSDRVVSEEERARNTRFRDRIVLFGDGAGAFVVAAGEEDGPGFLDFEIRADGDLWDKMWVPAGGSAYRPYFDPSMFERGDTVPIVEGREVFRVAVTRMPESVVAILERNGLGLCDLDLLVMHQANLRINEAVQQRLGLPDAKVYNNIQKYGNTTAATLPMAFHEAREARDLKPGALVCFVALGSGLTWGAALYRV
jgi:3-oxoacyl-[acyl-carrier-protein] synthase-3